MIVAAGLGVRMGAGHPKALLPVAGRPLVAFAAQALDECPDVTAIVVVAPPGHEDELRAAVSGVTKPLAVVPGGSTRSRSVALGLDAVPAEAARVLVHDAARPLITPQVVSDVLGALDGADGAIAAAPVADTLKRASVDIAIAATVDREGLWGAQTPQAFRAETLRAAFMAADEAALDAATDCAWLVERAGGRVRLVHVRTPNVKVTTPADAEVAAALLSRGPSGLA